MADHSSQPQHYWIETLAGPLATLLGIAVAGYSVIYTVNANDDTERVRQAVALASQRDAQAASFELAAAQNVMGQRSCALAVARGTQTATGTTYGTVVDGTSSQSAIYFTKTTNGGGTWSDLMRIDAQAKGNQFYPDIDANAGKLHVVWQDTRTDAATDWLTLPFQNTKAATNPPGSTSTGAAVRSIYATSSDDGTTWTTPFISAAYALNWEQFGNRDIPFFGDYNYISAVGTTVLMNWADGRDTVAGTDPRYTNGDGTDGFDVWQCRVQNPTTGAWSADNCPNAGGLDQQIWGHVIP